MYEVDDHDVVVLFPAIPSPSAGAPEPVVLADEAGVVVAYYAPDNINADTAASGDFGEEEVVVVRFGPVHSLMFGAPNDEALHGHPLIDRGLEYYAAHRVENSSLVRRLERMNRVHSMHNGRGFAGLAHFIVTFHDSTLECVCGSEPQGLRRSRHYTARARDVNSSGVTADARSWLIVRLGSAAGCSVTRDAARRALQRPSQPGLAAAG